MTDKNDVQLVNSLAIQHQFTFTNANRNDEEILTSKPDLLVNFLKVGTVKEYDKSKTKAAVIWHKMEYSFANGFIYRRKLVR